MRVIFVVLFIYMITAEEICVNNILHKERIVVDNTPRAFTKLNIDRKTNKLFFSNMYRGKHVISYINLDDNDGLIHNVKGVVDGYSTAIDQKNGKIYFGSNYGIYKFDYSKNEAFYIGAFEYTIKQMFYEKSLYFIFSRAQHLYKFINGTAKLQKRYINLFAVDKNHTHYYTISNGLFLGAKKDNMIIFSVNVRKYYIQDLVTDKLGDVYIIGEDTVLRPDINSNQLIKVANIPDLRGWAYDRDNRLFYANYDKIAVLIPTEVKCDHLVY